MKVAISILGADFSNLKKTLDKVRNADYIHFDVMDGHFVPNITFGQFIGSEVKKLIKLPIQSHLMVTNPSKYLKEFAKFSQMIIIHPEIREDTLSLIKKIKRLKKKVGIAINPETPVSRIKRYLDKVDLVLVMTVHPGFSGQKFIKKMIPKFKELRENRRERKLRFKIQVDGGITFKTIRLVDADIVVSANFVNKSKNPREIIRKLQSF